MDEKMIAVESSVIKRIGYDEETQILAVEFKNNKTYCYADVPKDMFDAFVNAGSIGMFFSENIKDEYDVIPA
jgi:hypothetical protein